MRFEIWEPPTFDERGMTKWGWKCSHPYRLKIGRNVDIGAFCYIQSEDYVILEDGVQISGGCKIYSVNTIEGKRGRVAIRKGACVGANSVVLPGVNIGEYAVVGALSLVKTDVPAGEVWGGVPARRIKRIPREYPTIPITEITGIDMKTVEALKSKGIEDVLTLARKNVYRLSAELGVSLKEAQYLIREARLRMEIR